MEKEWPNDFYVFLYKEITEMKFYFIRVGIFLFCFWRGMVDTFPDVSVSSSYRTDFFSSQSEASKREGNM